MVRCLLFLVLLAVQQNLSAQVPSLRSHTVTAVSSVEFKTSRSNLRDRIRTEVPPWIIPGGLRTYFFVDGTDTYAWSSGASLATGSLVNMDNSIGPFNVSLSYIRSSAFHPEHHLQNWKRNYHAIYSANYFVHPAEGPVSIGFLHGENKNQVVGDINSSRSPRYQNTIQQNVRINPADHNTYSGGVPFIEGWNAYNAIISAAWIPNNKGTNWGQDFFRNELGPIVWPSTGYITRNGIKCTSGLKHPSSIIHNGYIYVFFADGGVFGANIPAEEGRREGVKVVRVKTENALNPAAYEVYYKSPDGLDSWLPSLPDGFTKENMLDYVAVKGPKSTDLMDDKRGISQEVRFSVAKVINTDYFAGVEQYIDIADNRKFKVAIRLSKDLIHWSDRVLQVAEANSWENTEMNYPIFLNKNGWTNTEIDLEDFYILGTASQPGRSVNRIHIYKAETMVSLSERRSLTIIGAKDNYLFPNPSKGEFSLVYNVDTLCNTSINIFDVTGKRVLSLPGVLRGAGIYNQKFHLQTFPAGIYFIELLLNDRRKLYKLVKS
jgi:hypothetical protein